MFLLAANPYHLIFLATMIVLARYITVRDADIVYILWSHSELDTANSL